MQEIPLKKDILKGDYKKSIKKLTLISVLNPIPFNGQNYQTQKGLGTSYQLLFKLPNKLIKIYLLVIYYLTKFDVVI